jgi:hypothetical protein
MGRISWGVVDELVSREMVHVIGEKEIGGKGVRRRTGRKK